MSDLWSLPSNDGWNKCYGRITDKWEDSNNGTLFLSDISIEGVFYERNKEIADAKLLPDFLVKLPQVVIPEANFKSLITELEQWLISAKEISIELSGVLHQSFILSFVIDKKFICSMDKPVCKILYSAERMNFGEWNFIVDQSCIRLFKDDLIKMCEANSIQL